MAVIRRIFELGNAEEKNEITQFYGFDIVNAILNK